MIFERPMSARPASTVTPELAISQPLTKNVLNSLINVSALLLLTVSG